MARSPLSTRSCYIIVVLMIAAFVLMGQNASTLTYQQETDVQFTFNPVINIGLSGDLVIPELNPGTSSDSNIITVTTGTNDIHGYSLFANVGNNQKNYTDLRMENNSTDKFTNLSTVRTALTDFTDNEWGYSYSSDNINWISGDVDSSTMGYAGLPLHNATNSAGGVKIFDTNTPTDVSLKFKIGAKASPDQPSGTYTNIVNFFGVAKVLATDYTLNYIDTSGTATGIPGDQTGITNNAVVTISNSTPTKAGHVFKGWCDASTNDDTCSGNVYMPGSLYIINNPGQTTTINLYAMWAVHIAPLAPTDCPARSICYAPNADDVEGSMSFVGRLPAAATGGKQSASTNSTATLTATNYKRTGYGLAGWSTSYSAVPGTDKIYGPNETISTNPSNGGVDISTNGLILYPVWIASTGNLQSWTGCSSMNTGDITALRDLRDDNVYTVAKLKDNKCWMTENLRLADKDASGNDIELSNTNTHNPSLPLTNSDGSSTSNHLSAPIDPAATAWCTDYTSACMDKSMLSTNNTTMFTANVAITQDSNVYSYGNYYNWYSATAGNGKYGSSYGSGYVAPGDICPAGWHLPTGNTSGEFKVLNTALSGTDTGTTASRNLRSYPNNFVYSGDVQGPAVYNRGSRGRYWSSSAYGSIYAYILQFTSSRVNPGTYDYNKYSGLMARCVSGM